MKSKTLSKDQEQTQSNPTSQSQNQKEKETHAHKLKNVYERRARLTIPDRWSFSYLIENSTKILFFFTYFLFYITKESKNTESIMGSGYLGNHLTPDHTQHVQ